MLIELHMIQNFAPSNLNRDDTNNPKDCEFGGTRRARISSQCLKRAIRSAPVFASTTGKDNGLRTKRLVERIQKPLQDAGKSPEDVCAIVPALVAAFASKLDKDNQRTAVLLYISQAEIAGLAGAIEENWADLADPSRRSSAVERLAKDLSKQYRQRTSAPDIALFGRMLAEKPELSLDAACQVAPALSTHRVTMEMDFYTAVDDLQPGDTAGAGMMGFTGYDSACFYRYALIDWEQLCHNLDGDRELACRTVEGFLRASVQAIPTGKQNSFAAHNPPSFLLATVRKSGQGWSLANAFERPVRPATGSGLVSPSVAALDTYWGRLQAVYGDDSLLRATALTLDPDLELKALDASRAGDLKAWICAVLDALPGGEAK